MFFTTFLRQGKAPSEEGAGKRQGGETADAKRREPHYAAMSLQLPRRTNGKPVCLIKLMTLTYLDLLTTILSRRPNHEYDKVSVVHMALALNLGFECEETTFRILSNP